MGVPDGRTAGAATPSRARRRPNEHDSPQIWLKRDCRRPGIRARWSFRTCHYEKAHPEGRIRRIFSKLTQGAYCGGDAIVAVCVLGHG